MPLRIDFLPFLEGFHRSSSLKPFSLAGSLLIVVIDVLVQIH
jgi:hypothetical protein